MAHRRSVGRSEFGRVRGAFKWNQLSRIIIMRTKETARFESRKLFWRYSATPPRTALIVIVCSACYARRDVGKHGIDNWEITVEDDVWRIYFRLSSMLVINFVYKVTLWIVKWLLINIRIYMNNIRIINKRIYISVRSTFI